jgi:hypothetical protein
VAPKHLNERRTVLFNTVLAVAFAWVLWERSFAPPADNTFEPIEGFFDKESCDAAASARVKEWTLGKKESGEEVSAFRPYGIIVQTPTKVRLRIEWRCLPDTVDPRPRTSN